jgi:hypothetical protein
VIIARVRGPQLASGSGGSAATAAQGNSSRPVHALIWTFLGVFALGGLMMLAMAQWLAAGACLVGGLCAGIAALVQRLSAAPSQPQTLAGPLGRGPYLHYDCTPDMEFVGRLAGVAQELRGAAVQGDRVVDWPRFNDHEARGKNAQNSGDLCQAVAHYCAAISFMIGELRKKK